MTAPPLSALTLRAVVFVTDAPLAVELAVEHNRPTPVLVVAPPSERQELDDVDVGDVVLHCGQLLHGASPTTRGVRYLLVCFVDVAQGDLAELLGSSSLSIAGAG